MIPYNSGYVSNQFKAPFANLKSYNRTSTTSYQDVILLHVISTGLSWTPAVRFSIPLSLNTIATRSFKVTTLINLTALSQANQCQNFLKAPSSGLGYFELLPSQVVHTQKKPHRAAYRHGL